jgi:hypothetical protein
MWSRRERRRRSEPRYGKIKATLRCRVSRCLHIISSEGFPHEPSGWALSFCFPSILNPTFRGPVRARHRRSCHTHREVRA